MLFLSSTVPCRLPCSRHLLFIALLVVLLLSAVSPAGAQPRVSGRATTGQMSAADTAKLRQALSAYEQGRSQEAQPVLEDLLTRYPENFDMNETLGLIRAESGDISAALPLLQHAARLQPRAAVAHANLGTEYLKLDKPQQALVELQLAGQLDPHDQQTQTALAHAYMETHDPAKAARAFAAAAALGPLDADTTHDRALALLQSNDAAAAGRVLAALPAAQQTDSTEALDGEVQERLGHYQQAEQHFSQAAHLNPSEPNIYAWTVELLRHFSWQPAVKIADYGIQQFPTSRRLQAARGIGFYADNRYQEAAAAFSTLLAADPENATYASLLGRSCALVGDPTATGCDSLEHFAEQHPGNAEAATYAATTLLHRPAQQRDNTKARALLLQAIAADPKLADAYYQLGVLDQEETQWQQSTTPLERAIALKPELAEAHYRLARAYSHLGRREDATKEIELQQRYAKEAKANLDARLKEVTTFLTTSQ